MSDSEYLKTGTTTIGIVCKDGVVLAADKRSTAGYLVANKKQTKVFPIAPNIVVTQAGLVSDAQLLTKLIKAEIKLMEIQTGRAVTVKEAAHLLGGMLYSNIRRPSMVPGIVGFLLGGVDKTGNALFNLGIDGSITDKDDFDSEGSGSVFALGVLESQFKPGMSVDDGIKLAEEAINAALQRDIATGNGIDIYVITEAGAKKVLTKEVNTGLRR